MKKLALAASIATLALGGAAIAAVNKDSGFSRDATVARADALARAAQKFDLIDANKDGKLDAADREARRTAAFDRIDANKDGAVSRAEFTATRPAGQEMNGERGGRHGMRGHGMRGGMGRGMMQQAADTNRDGAITRAEFNTAAATRFDRADANHDGQLTPAERQATRAAMRDRMRDIMQRRGQDAGTQAPVN